jgi:hypothetical protein
VLLVVRFRVLQSALNQVYVAQVGAHASGGLFLEAVKNVNHTFELHCVDGAIGVAIKILNNFHDASSTKTLQWLGRWMLPTDLGLVYGKPKTCFTSSGIAKRSVFAEPMNSVGRLAVGSVEITGKPCVIVKLLYGCFSCRVNSRITIS